MTDEQKKEWENLYDNLMEKPKRILEIFSDYFGEDKVDMQGFCTKEKFCENKSLGKNNTDAISLPSGTFILVWFPQVKVTNEFNKSVNIQDLYAKMEIDTEGQLTGKFYLNRATYPLSHMRASYMHSHVPGINTSNFSDFLTPCTGSGPINATIGGLNREFDEDMWQLFCSELEDFIQVESIAGVPYRRLENIGANRFSSMTQKFSYVARGFYGKVARPPYEFRSADLGIIPDFTRYLLKNVSFPMEYSNGTYCLGMSYYDATILISNKFIEWFNLEDNPYRKLYDFQYLKGMNILEKYMIADGKIYTISATQSINSYMSYEGKFICNFKGREIKLHIDNTPSSEQHLVILLQENVIRDIVSAICKVVNLRYGRKEGEEESELDRQTFYV